MRPSDLDIELSFTKTARQFTCTSLVQSSKFDPFLRKVILCLLGAILWLSSFGPYLSTVPVILIRNC